MTAPRSPARAVPPAPPQRAAPAERSSAARRATGPGARGDAASPGGAPAPGGIRGSLLALASGQALPGVADLHDPAEHAADRFVRNHAAHLPRAVSGDRPADGGALPGSLRQPFEALLGTGLADVRVHTGQAAQQSAARLGAQAWTRGSDIHFGTGRYEPHTEAGSRLLAHELAHVARDRHDGVIHRQLLEEGATDAANDQRLQGQLQTTPALAGMAFDELPQLLGGLTGWRRRLPLSWALARQQAVAAWGAPAVAALENNDAALLALVTKSDTLRARLASFRAQFPKDDPDDVAARGVIDFYAGTGDLFSLGERGLYELSYTYFGGEFAKDSAYDLRVHQALLAGDVEEMLATVSGATADAVESEQAERAQREAWTAAATAFIGRKFAHRSGIIFDDDLVLESLMAPTWGSENEDDMLALARHAGHMAAVIQVGRRFHAYLLNENMSREKIFVARDWDQASLIVDDGLEGARIRAVVTSDSFVVNPQANAEVMFGGDQARRPLDYLEADTRLAQSGEGDPVTLFQSMVRNLAMVHLLDAERRLRGIIGSMTPGWGVDPVAGRELQRQTARLRDLSEEAMHLGDEIGEKAPDAGQASQRDTLLQEMGELVQLNPAAAFFVARHETPTWMKIANPMMASFDAAQGTYDDKLAGEQGGDAASMAIEQAHTRLGNIDTVRRAMFDDPDIVLGFEPLFDPVYAYFSEGDQRSIRMSLAWREFKSIAASLAMTVVDLGLLVGGFFSGGATWIGLGVEAVGVGIGAYQLNQQYQQTQLTVAMAAVDVPGGYELASPEAAESAQRWLYIGAALNFLGFCGLTRTASRMMRAASDEAALMGRIARTAGVSEEAIAGAFRRGWRGQPLPSEGSLRELLFARMSPALRERYAGIPIEILDEAKWAERFPKNAGGQAAVRFDVVGAADPAFAKTIYFRSNANPLSMLEEGEHIAQATGELSGKVRLVVEASRDWGKLSTLQRMEAGQHVLEIEAQAQEKLMARAQQAQDMEGLDDALEELSSINQREAQLQKAIDEGGEPPKWFDPTHPPEVLFNAPRLPRSRGSWSPGSTPGNGTWLSTRPEVNKLVKAQGLKGVEFHNMYPDFRPWKVYEVRLTQAGTASDFADADLRLAENIVAGKVAPPTGYPVSTFRRNGTGDAIAVGAERYRQGAGLTWHHHQGGNVMLLVPTELHANIPHTGGAAAARAASP